MEKEEVDKLNKFQKVSRFHPMTCGNRDEKHLDNRLVATESGWICPFCDYKQPFGKIENHILIIDWDAELTKTEIQYGQNLSIPESAAGE